MLLTTACGGGDSSSDADGNGGNGDTATLRLVTTSTAASLPAFVAIEEGMFEDAGLDVKLQITEDLTSIPAILGQQYDIGIGVQPVMIRAAASGIDVVQVAGAHTSSAEKPALLILTKPDSGIEGPEDLVGKRLAAPTVAGNFNLATMYWLEQEGVDSSAVNVVQVNSPNIADQLEAGQVDAAEVPEPFSTVLQKRGYVSIGYPLEAVADPCPMASWIANGEWAADNSEVIDKFRSGLQEATDFIESDPDRAYEVLADRTGSDLETLKQIPMADYTVESSVENLEPWLDVMRSVGGFDQEIDLKDLIAD